MSSNVKNPQPGCKTNGDIMTCSLYFSVNNSILDSSNIAVIEKIKQHLTNNSDIILDVNGFASSDGMASYNLSLSERRRNEVVGKLSVGGDKAKVIGTSYGESRSTQIPSSLSASEKEHIRRLDRKVTLLIMPAKSTSVLKLQIPLKLDYSPPKLKPRNLFDEGIAPPPAPTMGEILSKKLESNQVYKTGYSIYNTLDNVYVGGFKIDIIGSVGGSLNLQRKIISGKSVAEIMADEQQSYDREQKEKLEKMYDHRN